MKKITNWFKQQFTNPEVVYLLAVLLGALLLVIYASDMLAPVLASIVIAYLLDGLVSRLQKFQLPRVLAVTLVFLLFIAILLLVVFALLPVLYNQLTEMVRQIPQIFARGQLLLSALPEQYPELFSVQQVQQISDAVRAQLTETGQDLLADSFSRAVDAITLLVYFILLPILVFFFLMDKARIHAWCAEFLPRDSRLVRQVWRDVDIQIGNYIRGKFWEILIVWLISYFCFAFFGLPFAMLLALLVGLSVLIPYVGAVVITIPVVLVAWFQWGWSDDFVYLVLAYLVIQALDGNLLVPLLFSKVVNLHPVAIIVAVLVFGGLWGIWGVFFAIPLTTLLQAVLLAWPKSPQPKNQ